MTIDVAVPFQRPTRIPDALTVEEAARLLRVSARTVRRRIARYEAGDLMAWPTHVIRLGRIVRIPAGELLAVLAVTANA
ncbi:MAG TPA: helix-turn-helix domain-containing protein [Acidimicrobiales bacterium]|nr:helix-turn-helix domain-containing protein [Acidimicrobiales bacterium]